MATYEYAGLSFYIKKDKVTEDHINVLRGFITPLFNSGDAPMNDDIFEAVENVQTFSNNHIKVSITAINLIDSAHHSVTQAGGYDLSESLFANDIDMPGNMPKDKETAHIDDSRDDYLYVYIPLTGARNVDEQVNYVKAVMTGIFDDAIVQAAELRHDETEDYDATKAKIFIKN